MSAILHHTKDDEIVIVKRENGKIDAYNIKGIIPVYEYKNEWIRKNEELLSVEAPENIEIKCSDDYSIEIQDNPVNSVKEIKYFSNDEELVKIDNNGHLSPQKIGETEIVSYYIDTNKKIIRKIIPITLLPSILIDGEITNKYIPLNKETKIEYITNSNVEISEIILESNDNDIISVNGDKIIGNISDGSALIQLTLVDIYGNRLTVSKEIGVKDKFALYNVQKVVGSTFGFDYDENEQCYISSNKGVNSSYSYCKVNLEGSGVYNIVIDYISNGENSYDYGIISNLNTDLSLNNISDSSSSYLKNCKGESSSEWKSLGIENIDLSATPYLTIKYIKDGSSNQGLDQFKFKIRFEEV